MKAMIFSAGLGTRLKPLTENRPKALIEIGRKTLIERCIIYLKAFRVNNITINVHHYSKQIIDFLYQNKNFGVHINISDETDLLLDTGGAILKARPFLEGEEPILLINVDVLTNLDLHNLLQFHNASKALATLVVRERISSRYLMFNGENQLSGWKDTKSGKLKMCRPESIVDSIPFAFSGIHIIEPELLTRITETGKFSVIDLYLRLAATQRIVAFIDRQSLWMDLGKYEEIDLAEKLAGEIDDSIGN